MIGVHKHHIIPRHAGGSDSPENLVELTVEDHAIAHKVLYGLWGREEDRIAWLCLSGRITSEDARKAACKIGYDKRDKSFFESTEYKEKQRKGALERGAKPPVYYGDDHPLKNSVHKATHLASIQTEEYRAKQRIKSVARWKDPTYRKLMEECHREYVNKLREKIECDRCGKFGVGIAMKRWHFDNCRMRSVE